VVSPPPPIVANEPWRDPARRGAARRGVAWRGVAKESFMRREEHECDETIARKRKIGGPRRLKETARLVGLCRL